MLLFCALQARGSLGGIPHVQDEQGYLLQARIFAEGARTAPPLPGHAWMSMEFQEMEPRWYSIFPPGWPLVLALGVAAGAPWLVNPLLASTLPWLCWAAFRRPLGGEVARLTAILVALSPGVLMLGGSWMSHTLTLACALAALAGAQAGVGGALLAGLATGLLAATRPWDAALVGGPLCLYAVAQTARGRWSGARLAAFAAGPTAAALLLLWDNQALTGSPWMFPVTAYFERGTDWGERWPPGCNRLGLGPGHGCASYMSKSGYTLSLAARNVAGNARYFDQLFLGFTGGGLLAALGLPALLRRAPALALPAALVPLGYGLYWYHGVCYGARFWHCVYLSALPAAALALRAVITRLRTTPLLAALPSVLGLALSWPGLQEELRASYWCVDDTLAPRLERLGVRDGLVLLDDRGQLRMFWQRTKLDGGLCNYGLSAGAGLARNDPWGRGAVVWMRQPDPEHLPQVLSAYPERPVWRVVRDLSTGAALVYQWAPDTETWTAHGRLEASAEAVEALAPEDGSEAR